MVTRWTQERVESFRAWHEQVLKDLYSNCPEVQKELRNSREKWLGMVTPRN